MSPVWLQVKRQGKEEYEVTGLHDVDHAWIKTIKHNGAANKLKGIFLTIFGFSFATATMFPLIGLLRDACWNAIMEEYLFRSDTI